MMIQNMEGGLHRKTITKDLPNYPHQPKVEKDAKALQVVLKTISDTTYRVPSSYPHFQQALLRLLDTYPT